MVTSEQKKVYKSILKEKKAILNSATRKSKLTYFVTLLSGAVLGISLVIIGFILEENKIIRHGYFKYYTLLGFALLYLFFFLHIIIHEAGHLVFGLISGYRFLSFRIFSIIFVKVDGHIVRKRYSLRGTAGQCLMYPPKREYDGSFPFILYNLGGSIANLIFSVVFIIPIIITDNAIARTIYIAFSMAGILTAATNLLPMNLGVQNDGMNLRRLLKDKYSQECFYLQLKINADLSDGKSITDYSLDTFSIPEEADEKDLIVASNYFYSYYWLLAKQYYESAYRYLLDMSERLSRFPVAAVNMIYAEQLFFAVLKRKPVEEIAALYSMVRFLFAGGKDNVAIRRIHYIYEALLSEDEKQDIMTLIGRKGLMRWKQTDREKLYGDFVETVRNHPVLGEAEMHMSIVNYCMENYIKKSY
ncbi:hypothetical protein [Herbinix luporum]|uniref:M50 family metallopeptidase n=1 Tax=Herbinix luporum TaxID=1679721 RepID=A0A0K8J442_9FIRM|nr:hypothetical protein [Herbinix luporum]CUH92426.1 hypothetical protein SD1D_0878 [Herbinix luporum]HHT57027.1 hypothetical protein [Herbinix luporum]